MPVSEKDIFASLMQDPNHAYNPIEKVWAEAQQRARQFRNNEKALSLGFDTPSAIEKLFDFVQKAVDENDYKHRLSANLESYNAFFERAKELFRLEAAWGDYTDFDPGQTIQMGRNDISLSNFNEVLKTVYPGFVALNEFVERLNSDQDLTFADAIENESPEFKMFMDSWVGDTGELSARLSSGLTNYEAHEDIQAWNTEARNTLEQAQPEAQPEEQPEERNPPTNYDELTNEEKSLFHAQMGIASNTRDAEELGQPYINDVEDTDEFKNKVSHFIEGLALPNLTERTNFWGTYTPLNAPEAIPFTGNENEGIDGPTPEPNYNADPVPTPIDLVNPQPAAAATPEPTGATPLFEYQSPAPTPTNEEETDVPPEPYSGNIKEGYEKFAPRTLNDENEENETLLPKIDGEEFDPFDNVENDLAVDATVRKLVKEYVKIHEGEEDTPHLGNENPYFPGEGTSGATWKFDPERFDTPQKKTYNELNANKAIIEEYLRVLFSARDGNVDASGAPSVKEWNDHRTRVERRVLEQNNEEGLSFNQIMIEETSNLLPEGTPDNVFRMDTIPHPGAWDWYQLLNTMQGLSSKLTLEGEDPDDYRDANNNPSFHLIPKENFQRLGYKPTHAALNSFNTLLDQRVLAQDAEIEGEEDSTSGLRALGFDKNIEGLAKLRVARKKAENSNDPDYANFSLSGRGLERNHFKEAWTAFTAGRSNQRDEDGVIIPDSAQIPPNIDFMEWVGMRGDDADPAVRSNQLWRKIPGHPEGAEWVRRYSPTPAATEEIIDDDEEEVDEEDEEEVEEEEVEEGIPETPEEAAARIAAEEQTRVDELEAARVAEQERAEAEAARKADRTRKIDSMIETEKLLGDFEGDEEDEHRGIFDGLDDDALHKEFLRHADMRRKHRIRERGQRDKADAAADKEANKAAANPERPPEDLEKLKADFTRVYEKVYGPLSEDFFDSYSTDYETLDKEYKKALQVQHNNANKEAQGLKQTNANNIVGPHGIDPLPEPPTKDDLIHQIRHIQMWKAQHGPNMTDKEAVATLKQLEIEAYQKANNAGFDAQELNDKDKKDAEGKNLSYGSTEWFDDVGKTHVADQQKGARYRRQVQKGGELRSNSNYKPWLVIQYDQDGNGKLVDLRTQQEVRREDLKFDKETKGFDYSGSETPPEFTDPESAFWDNLDYANLQPIRTDEDGRRSATQPPQIGHSPRIIGQGGTRHAWYHPESQSWINPHRYQDAMDELGTAAPGSGMLIPHGSNYHGTNQSGNRDEPYGFQATGTGKPHSYYLDGQGNIAHVNTDYEHRKVSPDYSQPQTVNSVIHDWHSDHMQQQVKADQASFLAGPNQIKDSVILNPQQQVGPKPLQNAVQVGDALHRKREQGSAYGKRRFDSLGSDELGIDPTYYGQRSGLQRTPKKGMEKLKQNIMAPIQYTESGVLSGLAKLILNTANIGTLGILGLGWGKEQDNIKRHRANYDKHSKIQRGVQDHMASVTDNGRERQYLSPGEQAARKEDHKALQEDFNRKQAEAQNRAREHKNAGNKTEGDKAEADSIRFQGLKQSIDKRKIENPADWKHIDSLYRQHYGSPEVQATLAPAIGEQPSRNLADIFQPPAPPQAEAQPEIVPNWESSPRQPKEIVPNWS